MSGEAGGKRRKDQQHEEGEKEAEGVSRPKHARTAADIQRAKLAKLMKNPDRPAHIPQPKGDKNPNKAPEFVYNVMGSSAGAGSGEFHVYRQIRRKETLRQNVLGAQKEREDLNEAYHQKLEENQRLAEERTAKKRQKRQKKKEKAKKKKEEKKKDPGGQDSQASVEDKGSGDEANKKPPTDDDDDSSS